MSRVKKVVLAFSGGLDTSFCAVHLSRDLGFEVHAVTINTGGFASNEAEKLRESALELGCASFSFLDVTRRFYEEGIRFLIFGNVLKNNTYPLSVSAERTFQAVALAEYASEIGATAIAHGSTGAGNDQVRFDYVFNVLLPNIEIMTPIRDKELSRADEIAYLKNHGVQRDWAKSTYSINQGLWGTSVGGAETLTSDTYLPESAWPTQLEREAPLSIALTFKSGEPFALRFEETEVLGHPVEVIQALEEIASPFGIGRDIHVGDTIIGIKGRVGFEAAAASLLIKAHHLLEKHTLSKWQLNLKDQLALWYGQLMHEGQFLEPAMRDMEAFFSSSQARVSGTVFLRLFPRRFEIHGCSSPFDLMQAGSAQYGEMNSGWSGQDVKGFTKILANQVGLHRNVENGGHK